MRASFERGDPSAPRGHALLYFREIGDRERIRASYVVITPIEMDFAKYVPPMFAGQLAGMLPSGPAALPLPPIPESVASLAWLERLADARHDDLLDGGTIDPANPQQMMLTAAELAGEYAALWTERAAHLAEQPPTIAEEPGPAALPDVEDIFINVMTDGEKVERLAKLAGTLRYAVELHDAGLEAETANQMQRVGRHLPASYRFERLLAVGRGRGAASGRLLQLYVERSYKLATEDYAELERLDRQISELEA
jgi:hypothetical protein